MSVAGEPASPLAPVRRRVVVASSANGQPRTLRVVPSESQHAAYRRLAMAILSLDVATLARELRAPRHLAVRHAA